MVRERIKSGSFPLYFPEYNNYLSKGKYYIHCPIEKESDFGECSL